MFVISASVCMLKLAEKKVHGLRRSADLTLQYVLCELGLPVHKTNSYICLNNTYNEIVVLIIHQVVFPMGPPAIGRIW